MFRGRSGGWGFPPRPGQRNVYPGLLIARLVTDYTYYDFFTAIGVVGVALFAVVSEILSRKDAEYQATLKAFHQAADRVKALTNTEPLYPFRMGDRFPLKDGRLVLHRAGYDVSAITRIPPENSRRWFRQRVFWPFRRATIHMPFFPSLREPLSLPVHVPLGRFARMAKAEMEAADRERQTPYNDIEAADVVCSWSGARAVELLAGARWLLRAYSMALSLSVFGGLGALASVLFGW